MKQMRADQVATVIEDTAFVLLMASLDGNESSIGYIVGMVTKTVHDMYGDEVTEDTKARIVQRLEDRLSDMESFYNYLDGDDGGTVGR